MSTASESANLQIGVSSAPWKTPPPPDPLAAIKAATLAFLRSQREPLYALVDGSRADRILEVLGQHATPAQLPDPPARPAKPLGAADTLFQSLYLMVQVPDIAEHGPYLVQLPKDSALLPILVAEGWGQSWGVFLTSPATFAEVRKHFRHFLLVRHPDGDSILFRFFDPRVLRPFLPVCTPEEIVQFFGPIASFICEAERGQGLFHWVAPQGNLACREPLAAALL